VAEDLLEIEHVSAIDQVATGEGVAERVPTRARADAGPTSEPGDGVPDAAPAERCAVAADEQRVRRADGIAPRDVAEEGPPGGRSEGQRARFEPLPRTRIIPSGRMSPTRSDVTSESRRPVSRRSSVSARSRRSARVRRRSSSTDLGAMPRSLPPRLASGPPTTTCAAQALRPFQHRRARARSRRCPRRWASS
jgi:hypothetical protein